MAPSNFDRAHDAMCDLAQAIAGLGRLCCEARLVPLKPEELGALFTVLADRIDDARKLLEEGLEQQAA